MIPYYSPNLFFKDLLKLPFMFNSEKKIIDYYRRYTGKKYILLTSSCRIALYLAYQALEKKGEVITSPLTCKVAIDPILQSNNKTCYVDINIDTLNIDEAKIEKEINANTIAIQVIHLGGVSCNSKKIREIAGKHNIFMIEDCAQGFLASYDGVKCGELGDVSCFSMIKNAYGIGGGILATDNYEIYKKAEDFLKNSSENILFLSVYRIIRNLIETKRNNSIFQRIYVFLMNHRGDRTNKADLKNSIRKQNWLDKRINWIQLKKAEILNKKRNNIGNEIIRILKKNNLIDNYINVNYGENVYTKLYVYNNRYNSNQIIEFLNNEGIEVKHLEHEYKCYYQEKLTEDDLENYQKVHDKLISLPLHEKLESNIIEFFNNILMELVHEKKNIN